MVKDHDSAVAGFAPGSMVTTADLVAYPISTIQPGEYVAGIGSVSLVTAVWAVAYADELLAPVIDGLGIPVIGTQDAAIFNRASCVKLADAVKGTDVTGHRPVFSTKRPDLAGCDTVGVDTCRFMHGVPEYYCGGFWWPDEFAGTEPEPQTVGQMRSMVHGSGVHGILPGLDIPEFAKTVQYAQVWFRREYNPSRSSSSDGGIADTRLRRYNVTSVSTSKPAGAVYNLALRDAQNFFCNGVLVAGLA